jgi:hypothetical protein
MMRPKGSEGRPRFGARARPPSLPPGAERAGERWGLQSADSAHLTFPVAEATGPLPLRPKGREGIPILVGRFRARRRDFA